MADASTTAVVPADAHPLQYEWCWFFDRGFKAKKAKKQDEEEYESGLRELGRILTVEQFWSYFATIPPANDLTDQCNYHFFKKGIMPKWEDKANEKGGKWTIFLQHKGDSNQHSNRLWEETLMVLLGDMLDESLSEDICGAVFSRRVKNGNKVSVWNKTFDPKLVLPLGRRLVQLLNPPPTARVEYFVHKDSIQTGASFRGSDARFSMSAAEIAELTSGSR